MIAHEFKSLSILVAGSNTLLEAATQKKYSDAIENTDSLIVPSICITEVFRKLFREQGEDETLIVSVQMRQGKVIPLSEEIALLAGKLGVEHHIPLADSIILATGQLHEAEILTQDAHFRGLAGVEYFKKRSTH